MGLLFWGTAREFALLVLWKTNNRHLYLDRKDPILISRGGRLAWIWCHCRTLDHCYGKRWVRKSCVKQGPGSLCLGALFKQRHSPLPPSLSYTRPGVPVPGYVSHWHWLWFVNLKSWLNLSFASSLQASLVIWTWPILVAITRLNNALLFIIRCSSITGLVNETTTLPAWLNPKRLPETDCRVCPAVKFTDPTKAMESQAMQKWQNGWGKTNCWDSALYLLITALLRMHKCLFPKIKRVLKEQNKPLAAVGISSALYESLPGTWSIVVKISLLSKYCRSGSNTEASSMMSLVHGKLSYSRWLLLQKTILALHSWTVSYANGSHFFPSFPSI